MHKRSTDDEDLEPRKQMQKAPSFYHLCVRCDAKWFTEVVTCQCPRCGKECHSDVQMQAPWARPAKSTGE